MSRTTARWRSCRRTGSSRTSSSVRSRSSPGRSTSAAMRRPACGCRRRPSAATGGRRSRTAGAADGPSLRAAGQRLRPGRDLVATRSYGSQALRQILGPRRHALQLADREPALLVGALVAQVERRSVLERRHAHEIDAVRPAAVAGLLQAEAFLLPEQRPDLEAGEAALLLELAPQRLLVELTRLLPAARRDPPEAVVVAVAEEERAPRIVDDECADALPLREARGPAGELAEPPQPLGPRHGGIRGRGRRQHEQP